MARLLLVKFKPILTDVQDDIHQPLFIWELTNFTRFSYDINTPVTPAPLPEEDSDENVLLKIEGNSSQLGLGWKIKEESINRLIVNNSADTDVGTPVFTGNTKTIREQVNFFKEQLRPVSIDDAFCLILDYEEAGGTFNFENVVSSDQNLVWYGTFNHFKFETSQTETVTLNASCKFLEGNVATMYEVDSPSVPENFAVTSPSSGQIKFDWTNPLENGSSSIEGFKLFYKLGNGSYTMYKRTGTSPTNHTISSLTAGTYTCYMTAYSAVGEGSKTRQKVIVVS